MQQTVADVVEALIAVAYLASGNDAALEAAKSLHVAMPDVHTWTDFVALMPPLMLSSKVTLPVESIHAIEKVTGTKFKQPGILAQAFVSAMCYASTSSVYPSIRPIHPYTLRKPSHTSN